MSVICPTVTPTTTSINEYRTQLNKVAAFANRVQIDLMDGDFASPKTLDVSDIWWPESTVADVHLMYRNPIDYMETIVSLGPNMIIVHAEANGQIDKFFDYMHENGIRCGIALLQETTVESAKELIKKADHMLIFSGNLGSFGGTADFSLLKKTTEARAINSEIEIGWDGGANAETVKTLAQGGVNVINVGGAIQNALYPYDVYKNLTRRLRE